MTEIFERFQSIARRVQDFAKPYQVAPVEVLHPFDERNIHPDIASVSLGLFDNGHYSQATFEAFKYVDKQVSKISKIEEAGFKLMMNAFKEDNPSIQLTDLSSSSEKDEQKGFQFMFAGSTLGIRNPRGHEVGNLDSIEQALDHLCLASLLLRKLGNRVAP